MSKISIIIPVYNEERYVLQAINEVKRANTLGYKKEIIVVNDGSTDKTETILNKTKGILVIKKRRNSGKGSAISAGLKKITGQIIIIQDADLEYDPSDYRVLMRPIVDGDADVVFGSRFVGDKPHRVLFFWHMVANKLLTLASNMLTNLNLTDMETGYKVFSSKVARKLHVTEKRFGFEPEFTAKISAMNVRVYEVGISYRGRGYKEGKKIGWMDGLLAFYYIIKYNFIAKLEQVFSNP